MSTVKGRVKEEVDLSRLNDEVAAVVRDAIALGWRVTQAPHGGVRVFSPDRNNQTDRDIPPVRQWNHNKLRALREYIYRYSDRGAVDALKKRRVAEEQRRQAELAEEQRRVEERLAAQAKAQQVAADRVAEEQLTNDILRRQQDRHLVKKEVWIARINRLGYVHADGTITVRKSPAVLVRTWSDGSVDYECSSPHCDWVSDKPNGIATHYGRQVRYGHTDTHPVLPEEEAYRVPADQYEPRSPMIKRRERVKEVPEEVAAQPPGDPDEMDAQVATKVRELQDLLVERALDDLARREQELVSELEAERAARASEIDKLRQELVKMTEARDALQAELDELGRIFARFAPKG